MLANQARELFSKDPSALLKLLAEPLDTIATSLMRFIHDRVRPPGRGIIGLSGGLDSSTVAYLAAEALGPGHVTGLIMPSATSPPDDQTDARLVADRLGIEYRVIDIQPLIDTAILQAPFFQEPLARGNLMARLRMTQLYGMANTSGGLVIGTDNLTEARLGYFTKYGDGGVDLNPLGELYKTQVRLLARHLGVPARIIHKAPSAGLWEGQTDEAELGLDYHRIDRVLLGRELGFSVDRMVGMGLADADDIVSLFERIERNLHKSRLPATPGLKLYQEVTR